MNEVVPSSRFDNISFSNEIVDGHVLSIYSSYKCPKCETGVGFTKHDFEDRAKLRVSNLPHSIAVAMDHWAEGKKYKSSPFLDWLCPGCGLAVRAHTSPWAGGRHGDSGTDIVVVLEYMTGEAGDR